MKRIILFLGSFLLLSFPVLAAAPVVQSVGLSDVIEALENPFSAGATQDEIITDFKTDFYQESYIASLDRRQNGEGHVSMKFEKNVEDRVPKVLFRWEYRSPTRQEFVSNGRQLWVHLPENRQVILSNIEHTSTAHQSNPMTFLTGLGNLSRDFSIHWADPNRDMAGNFVLELTPRMTTSMFRKMLVVVDRNAVYARLRGTPDNSILPILSTSVYDPYDNLTIIEFINPLTNRGLYSDMFDFFIPANVDVVRPTGQSMGF